MSQCLVAQPFSNIRAKKIAVQQNYQIDSLSIVPLSFSMKHIDTTYFTVDYAQSLLYWRKQPPVDSVEVIYRVLPFMLSKNYQKYSFDDYINIRYSKKEVLPAAKEFTWGSVGQIQYTGSIGRSMSVGNNRGTVFNSQLNLQLEGYIADSIKIRAALSDNNLPLQPDGSTQILSDFDRVFLQFEKDKWRVDLGDVELVENQTKYANFYKRVQGIAYKQSFDFPKKIENHIVVSASMTKGRFTQNKLEVKEGNQGPYKLLGSNNELYIVVLSGTEKVFIDGVLMQRGEDADYIIDYNLAQISFTAKQMVNKDKRVVVEFEYSDKNYLNTFLYLKNELKLGNNLQLNMGVTTHFDVKTAPINIQLNEEKKAFLQNMGDSTYKAFFPISTVTPFDKAKVLYQQKDSLVDGAIHKIFVHTTDSIKHLYALHFVHVGHNKGHYQPIQSSANGQVYQWVAPANGVPQGAYEPAEFLTTPKSLQLLFLDGKYSFDSNTHVSMNIATSRNDVNTFSTLDKQNDWGWAGSVAFEKKYTHLLKDTVAKPFLQVAVEKINKDFTSLERFRTIEFSRDWGLPNNAIATDEYLTTLTLGVNNWHNHTVKYRGQYLQKESYYQGVKNYFSHLYADKKGLTTHIQLEHTLLNTQETNGYFWRPSVEIIKKWEQFFNYELQANYSLEENKQQIKRSSQWGASSFVIENIGFGIASDKTKNKKFNLNYLYKKNKLPVAEELLLSDVSHNISFTGELFQDYQNYLKIISTYRMLTVFNIDKFSFPKPENAFLGRVEYAWNRWKGLLGGNIFYEIGTGQEQKRAYTFIEVPRGQGQYTWIDYNKNGIAEQNEFELANFKDEAQYIKIFTPTNEFVKANYVQFNYSVVLLPEVWSSKMNKWCTWVKKLSLQSSLQSMKKELSDGHLQYNPFQGNVADKDIINLSSILSHILFINRNGRLWQLELGQHTHQMKYLMTYGAENKKNAYWDAKLKLNLLKFYMLDITLKKGAETLTTPSIFNKNYNLLQDHFVSNFTYHRSQKWRTSVGYQYQTVQNSWSLSAEYMNKHILELDAKYSILQNGYITGKLSFNKINFAGGDINSSVGYAMLQGLLPGNNWLWSLNIQKRIFKNFELSFIYEGRKTHRTHTLHTGSAGIRAIL